MRKSTWFQKHAPSAPRRRPACRPTDLHGAQRLPASDFNHSPCSPPKPLGFTLIELIVVLFILLLMTTAVVPRVVALQRSRRLKDMEGKVIRLPAQARNEAARTGKPVRLRVDGADLVLDRAPLNGATEEFKRVALGPALQVDSVEQDGRAANTGSWSWTVYPDGTAEAAGVRFTEGASERSLVLLSDGNSQWVRGDLPDGAPESWPAGRLQQRS